MTHRFVMALVFGLAFATAPPLADSQLGPTTTRVSVATGGGQANQESEPPPSISADGRFVAFWSLASNLVQGDTNGQWDVFVHDRLTGETSRVSVATGGGQGNRESSYPSISADGRFVAFRSNASNLVEGDHGGSDVFVHDRQTRETTQVSVATGGEQGNNWSGYPSISADGRHVAFWSDASNLVQGDTNGWYDVFVHDRQTGQTTRASVATSGRQGDGLSWFPSISADGRFLAFSSRASNLVAGDTNGDYDVFVRDRAVRVNSHRMVRLKQGRELEQGLQQATTPFARPVGPEGVRFLDFDAIERDQDLFRRAFAALPATIEEADLDDVIRRTATACETDEGRALTPDRLRNFVIDYNAMASEDKNSSW